MSDIDELYTDLIMEHSMHSPYKKDMQGATCSSLGHNPSCGDKITIQAKIEDSKIVDLAFSGEGCAISQSSSSIMIETLKGKTINEAKQIIEIFIKMIKRESISNEDKKLLKNARVFESVANMPSRAKCATLSWHTLSDLLNQINNKNV